MRYSNSILLFLSFALILNCSPSENSGNVLISESDRLIMEQLQGQWEGQWETEVYTFSKTIRTYNSDGTYSDSTIRDINRVIQTSEGELAITYTTCDEVYSNNKYLEKVIQGTYEVKDGILKTKATDLLFDCNPIQGHVFRPYFDMTLKFSPDTLSAIWTKSFTRTGSGSGLYGTWETEYTSYAQSVNLESGADILSVTEKAIFEENDSSYTEEVSGYPTGDRSFDMQYEYNPPELIVNSGSDSWDVDIDNNKMTWVYKLYEDKWVKVQ